MKGAKVGYTFRIFFYLININQKVKIKDLAQRFGVSQSTIRRCIAEINEITFASGYKSKCITSFQGHNGGIEILLEFRKELQESILPPELLGGQL